MKLDIRYADYFPEYSNYFLRSLRLLKSIHGVTNSENLFDDELTEWLLDNGFIQSQFQISIYNKYSQDGTKIVVLSVVDDCVYWYNSEGIGKWFVGNLGMIIHVKFLGYQNWFMSIRIYLMKDHLISVDQAIYADSIVAKYLDTATFKKSTKFYNITLPSDMIFTKSYASNSDEQVDKLTTKINIHYRACIGSLVYLSSTILDLSFELNKLAKFHQTLVKYI